MKLIYDLRIVGLQMHGMARYALELLRALLDLDQDLTIGCLVRDQAAVALLPQDQRLTAIICRLAPYGLWAQLEMPGVLRRLRPDLYHCPFYAPPRSFGGPMVITIHDLIHLLFPRSHGLRHRLFYAAVVGPAARRAQAVFTVSQSSKKDIARLLKVDPRRIAVTYNGVGEAFKPLSRDQSPEILGLPESYLLAVGNPKPHKNLAALVAAWQRLHQERQEVPPLVLVGVGAAGLPGVDPQPGLVMIEHLGEAALALAYGGAEAVAVPSLYEGFGLPALEALACGAPLLAARSAALPEVVGSAALLVEPTVEGLTRGLARLLADGKLRAELAAAGPARAAAFTWQRCASETWQVYQRIAAGEWP